MTSQLGIDVYLVSDRLHKLKAAAGLRGKDDVVICLDNGLVYAASSEDEFGDLNDP